MSSPNSGLWLFVGCHDAVIVGDNAVIGIGQLIFGQAGTVAAGVLAGAGCLSRPLLHPAREPVSIATMQRKATSFFILDSPQTSFFSISMSEGGKPIRQNENLFSVPLRSRRILERCMKIIKAPAIPHKSVTAGMRRKKCIRKGTAAAQRTLPRDT